jgi:hypothetical protein
MERIEISYASSFVIRPNGCVRQGHVGAKDLFDSVTRFGGDISLRNQSDDPMAFVEPSKGGRSCQQIEQQKN